MKRDPDIYNTRPIDIKRVKSERRTHHCTSATHVSNTTYILMKRDPDIHNTRPTDIKRVK